MTTSNNPQALVAAFSFGLVVHAATAAVLLVLKGRAANILRDGPRLALIAFLVSSALWAQIDFTAILISIGSRTSCQVAIVFASIFDQVSRVSVQQSLLWVFNKSTKASGTEILVGQAFILLRFILGGVFVGIQRPHLGTVCLARTSILPVGIVVVVLDAVFVILLLAKVISHRKSKDAWEGISTSQGRAVAYISVGLAIWTGTSTPLVLSTQSMPVVVRTALPATGLLVLIATITFFQGYFLLSKPAPSSPTGAQSFDDRDLNSRGISTADSAYPSSQHEELRRGAWDDMKGATRITIASAEVNKGLPVISRPAMGQAVVGMGGVPVQGQLFPPPRAQTLPMMEMRNLEKPQPQRLVRKGTKLVISNPILRPDNDNPLAKIPTVDLAIAAQKEKTRMDTGRTADGAKSATDTRQDSLSATPTTATTTSVLLSPGVEEIRRRSPRQLLSPNPSLKPPPLPREYLRIQPTIQPRDTVVNFSLPVDARTPTFSRKPNQPPNPVPLQSKGVDRPLGAKTDITRAISVVHRPRPIPRKPNIGRAIFPAEGSPNLKHHSRSLSCGSIRLKKPLEIQPPAGAGDLSSSQLSEFANHVLGESRPTNVANKGTRRRSLSVPELPTLSFGRKPSLEATLKTHQTELAKAISPLVGTRLAGSTQSPKSLEHTAISPGEVSNASSPLHNSRNRGFERRSSPVLPIEDWSALSPGSTIRDDDSTANWDVRSPAMEIHVQRAHAVKVTAAKQCQRSGLGVAGAPSLNEVHKGPLANHDVGLASDLRRAESPNTEGRHVWPSQVGETRPTFSDRGRSVKPRRSPPPAPLLLRRADGAIQAEPSPIDSEDGLEITHSRQDFTSLQNEDFRSLSGSDERMTLLANLELELNQQENQWQAIRHTMHVRDSLSTVGTSPGRDSRHGSRHSFTARLSRRAQLEQADIDLQSLLSQTGFRSSKVKLPTSAFPRFSASVASPTPPDTDESASEYEADPEALVGQDEENVAKAPLALWRPITPVAAATAATSLWTPAPKPAASAMVPETPDTMRRAPRKDLEPLTISSSRLWDKPVSQHQIEHHGLWQAQPKTQVVEVNVQQPTPRQPPRRIRRVTLLPDIPESPKPLPDRRGTLGIFQFPWGERSDSATVPAPARPLTFMAMPGTMASRGSHVNAGVVRSNPSEAEPLDAEPAEPLEYSLDDYERDDEYYDSSSDYETYESDDEDGFDETTLWEIVSLLEPSQRKNVSTEPHNEKSGLPSEQKEQQAAPAQDSAKFSEDESNSSMTDMGSFTTNISSSQTASPPARSAGRAEISQTQPPHSSMTLADMDLRERLHVKERTREENQGPAKLDAHLIASSVADAAIGGTPPRPEPPVASISSVPSESCPSISSVPVPQPLSGAPMNDAVAPHGTDFPQLLSNRTPASTSPLTWTSSPAQLPPSQSTRNQGLVHPVSWRVSKPADLSAEESAPANSAAHIQIRGAGANLDNNSLLFSFPLPPQHSPLKQHNPHWNLNDTPHIGSMALWSPSPIIPRPAKGLSQPDDATWKKYLPSDDIARVLPAKADLPTIESSSLWTLPAKKVEEPNHGLWGTKTPLPGMWSQPPVLQKVSYGLPQPDAETWATYLVVMDDVARVKPREAEPAFVESSSLWTIPKPIVAEVPSEDGLWSGSSSASLVSSVSGSEPSTPREAVNFGLWEPVPAVSISDDEEPTGLFSLSHRRTEFRTTKLSPAALDMERSPRRPLEAYPDFGFTHLWNMAPLWDANANAAAVDLQRELNELVLEGLFSLKHRRNNFRTTSEPPAALETRPKLRTSQEPLPKLSSDSLWSVRAPAKALVELDWITLSTTRPRTVSVASTDSLSSVPSLTTRASSIKSDKSARRVDATPAQWLAALDEAIRASKLEVDTRGQPSKDATILDLAAASEPGTPDSVSNYQLWSKPDDTEPVSSDELWKPSATARFLELTPALKDYDKQNAESGTSRRGRTLEARPPPPIYPGSSSSAFLPGASDTPRDFSAQALWVRAQSPAPGSREDGSWLDKSLRKSLSFVQLW